MGKKLGEMSIQIRHIWKSYEINFDSELHPYLSALEDEKCRVNNRYDFRSTLALVGMNDIHLNQPRDIK